MSLIRNGGFERGNTDFWEVLNNATFEVSTVSPLQGTYCGKITSPGSTYPVVLCADYIDVKPYQILDGILYCKSATTRQVQTIAYYYDVDYSLISTETGQLVSNDGTYKLISGQFRVPAGCAYARFGIKIRTTYSGEIFYLDGAGLEIIGSESALSGVIELLPYDTYTASGSTYYDAKSMMQFSSYYAGLNCYSVSGTSPTLDVTVKEVDIFNIEVVIGSFTTVTAATEERIDLPRCLGRQVYLSYTIGGTDPSFDLGISLVGKR